MQFQPASGIQWLAYVHDDQIHTGRIVGWETSGDAPVPVVVFTYDEGDMVAVPPPARFWIRDTVEEAVRLAERASRGQRKAVERAAAEARRVDGVPEPAPAEYVNPNPHR